MPLRTSALIAKQLAWAVVGVAGVTALLRLIGVHDTTIAALSFILVILAIATRAPFAAAVFTAVLAFIPFHFFFVPVIESFEVTDALNWLVLGTFLTVGIIGGKLAASARERAQHEREAEIATQRAQLSSALLVSLSHDLRTPLAATRVAIANVNDERLSPEERRRQAGVAMEQVVRLDRALHDILDLARIEAKGLRFEREWSTPAEIVEAALGRAGASTSGLRLNVEADEAVETELDPRLTTAALAYIIENALQYTPPGGTITVRGWAADGRARFTVADDGPGFDDQDAGRMFEPFYRGHAVRHVRKGTGLGLSIARGLISAEGGTITATRAAPHGAVFDVAVPAPHRVVTAELPE